MPLPKHLKRRGHKTSFLRFCFHIAKLSIFSVFCDPSLGLLLSIVSLCSYAHTLWKLCTSALPIGFQSALAKGRNDFYSVLFNTSNQCVLIAGFPEFISMCYNCWVSRVHFKENTKYREKTLIMGHKVKKKNTYGNSAELVSQKENQRQNIKWKFRECVSSGIFIYQKSKLAKT